MDSLLHIKSDFKTVYLLNGMFVESADTVKYGFNEPLYITTLPLEAQHLPYTVKLLGKQVLSNSVLCRAYSLTDNQLLLRLSPRYNYVYSEENRQAPRHAGSIEEFFHCVKNGKTTEARKLMTQSLNDSVDDNSLCGFFDDFTDIIKNEYVLKHSQGSYFLIDKENKGNLFNFATVSGLIDNIMQA